MVLFIIGLACLLALVWMALHQNNGKRPKPTQQNTQQMLYMSAALDVSDELISALGSKMDKRSLEIAKADGRFLITPEDMKKAYEEIIREEHM